MNLFKCHAVMPHVGNARDRVLKTYVVIAHTWQAARALVRAEAHGAEFATVPTEIDDVWLAVERLISEHEFAQLQVASEWNESRLISTGDQPRPCSGSGSD